MSNLVRLEKKRVRGVGNANDRLQQVLGCNKSFLYVAICILGFM